VSLDPEGLPGIYVGRVVATLDNCDLMSSLDAKRDPPVSGRKVSIGNNVVPPQCCCVREKNIAVCDGEIAECDGDIAVCDGSTAITVCDGGVLNVGPGECLPKCPESGSVPVAITCLGDLHAGSGSSLPVENCFGNHVDTNKLRAAQEFKGIQGQIKGNKVNGETSTINYRKNIQRNTEVLGYVPIQVINLSLEEVEIQKSTYIGVASPVRVTDSRHGGA
jgi:hypothetical protein